MRRWRGHRNGARRRRLIRSVDRLPTDAALLLPPPFSWPADGQVGRDLPVRDLQAVSRTSPCAWSVAAPSTAAWHPARKPRRWIDSLVRLDGAQPGAVAACHGGSFRPVRTDGRGLRNTPALPCRDRRDLGQWQADAPRLLRLGGRRALQRSAGGDTTENPAGLQPGRLISRGPGFGSARLTSPDHADRAQPDTDQGERSRFGYPGRCAGLDRLACRRGKRNVVSYPGEEYGREERLGKRGRAHAVRRGHSGCRTDLQIYVARSEPREGSRLALLSYGEHVLDRGNGRLILQRRRGDDQLDEIRER